MSLDLYASLGCTTLWNQAQTACYMRNGVKPPSWNLGDCSPCPGLVDLIPPGCDCHDDPQVTDPSDDDEEPGYQLPELDQASWYDEQHPESADFAGLLVTDVQMSAPISRPVTPNLGHGQTLGRTRLLGRSIVVRGILVARTCCAADYGLRWLTSALLGSPCTGSGDCGGDDFNFLTCCPTQDHEGCLATCDPITGEVVPHSREGALSEFQRGLDFLRTMHDVGVVDGPNIISKRGSGCGCGCSVVTEVEFTLATEQPWLYGEEQFCAVGLTPACGDEDVECFPIVLLGEDCEPCDSFPDCADDPLCPAPAAPPVSPIPLDPCVCEPVTHVSRVCCNIDSAELSDWFDATVNVKVSAGSTALRNLTIRAFQNPLSITECDDPRIIDCLACASLYVKFVPAGGTLEFSGERREILLTCGNVERSGYGNVADVSGATFDWIDLQCHDYLIVVEFDCENTGADASVDIGVVGRIL